MATEYTYHDRDDFVIDVELFPADQVATQMEDLLLAYRRHHHDNRAAREEEAVEDRETLAKTAALAASTFQAMFGGRAGREFLCARDAEDVLTDLRRWAVEAYPADMNGRMAPFATVEACSAELERVTSRRANGEARDAKWPFIRLVRCVEARARHKGP